MSARAFGGSWSASLNTCWILGLTGAFYQSAASGRGTLTVPGPVYSWSRSSTSNSWTRQAKVRAWSSGCLGGGKLAAHCRACHIRLCAANTRSVTRGSDCEALPCSRMTSLIDAGGYPHRKEYLPNLAAIRAIGVQDWVRKEEERWRCPKCHLPIRWYDTLCARCGEPRSQTLFPVSEDTPLPY
jgi:hypothetical protein